MKKKTLNDAIRFWRKRGHHGLTIPMSYWIWCKLGEINPSDKRNAIKFINWLTMKYANPHMELYWCSGVATACLRTVVMSRNSMGSIVMGYLNVSGAAFIYLKYRSGEKSKFIIKVLQKTIYGAIDSNHFHRILMLLKPKWSILRRENMTCDEKDMFEHIGIKPPETEKHA